MNPLSVAAPRQSAARSQSLKYSGALPRRRYANVSVESVGRQFVSNAGLDRFVVGECKLKPFLGLRYRERHGPLLKKKNCDT